MFGFSRSSSKQPYKALKVKQDQMTQEKQTKKNQSMQMLAKQFNPVNQLTATNQLTQCFSFRLQDLVDSTDPTLAWTYNIPSMSPNQKQLYLSVQTFTTSLIQYIGSQFPLQISIGLRNFSGFIGSTGIPSNKIIVLNLYSVQTSIINGVTQRDLVYKNDSNLNWALGSLRTLRFQVYVDQLPNPIPMPLSNPVCLNFKVIHVCY